MYISKSSSIDVDDSRGNTPNFDHKYLKISKYTSIVFFGNGTNYDFVQIKQKVAIKIKLTLKNTIY